jgi:hypothetical protein
VSILYVIGFLLINSFRPIGYFHLGRFVDLLQMDILIVVLWIYNHKRWCRLKRIDREVEQ